MNWNTILKYTGALIMCATTLSFADTKLPLTAPSDHKHSLHHAISARRSIRRFDTKKALTQEQISQLLWAAQGITDPQQKFRAAPSAGALYPLEVYVAKEDGLWHYLPLRHTLEQLSRDDIRAKLADAAHNQSYITQAPIDIIITAIYQRTAVKYGDRAERYVHIEVGHAAQNIALQAVALGLGSVTIGAFYDQKVQKLMRLPPHETPLYIMPVGYGK